MQGHSIYEEDVHVPLLLWFPRRYAAADRTDVVASHIDVAPTLAQLAGVPLPPDWQGRSLFDDARTGRAYFYVAEDGFTLGVREGSWTYLYDLREGTEELYDLTHDPSELQNVAGANEGLARRLRQRLAAWAEANREQYSRVEARK